MTLDEIGPAGWDTYLRGKWITPGGHPAGGRLIDYMMTSEDLIGALTLEWDMDGPWAAPHFGMIAKLDKQAFRYQYRIPLAPAAITVGMRGPDKPWVEHVEAIQQ
eukprot:2268463-Pyramimonas_sp.AAC.1